VCVRVCVCVRTYVCIHITSRVEDGEGVVIGHLCMCQVCCTRGVRKRAGDNAHTDKVHNLCAPLLCVSCAAVYMYRSISHACTHAKVRVCVCQSEYEFCTQTHAATHTHTHRYVKHVYVHTLDIIRNCTRPRIWWKRGWFPTIAAAHLLM
jgi:hypothetical protein